jgi:hypothetical protein
MPPAGPNPPSLLSSRRKGRPTLITRVPAASKAITTLEPHDLSEATQIVGLWRYGTIAQHRPPASSSRPDDARTLIAGIRNVDPISRPAQHQRAPPPQDSKASPSPLNPWSGDLANIYAPPELGAVAHYFPMTGENAARQCAVAYAQHQPPRKPPSPQVQQQPSPLTTQQSPSTVKASPQQTPGPFDASSVAEPSTKRGMRSQIACVRCRRSKTKCENTGQGTVCKACSNQSRECQWEHAAAASSTGPLRRDSTADDVSHVGLTFTLGAIPRPV